MPRTSLPMRRLAAPLVVACLAAGCADPVEPEQVDLVVLLPAPTLDLPPPQGGGLRTAVLAGGCFWGVEAVFEHVRGVVDVVSGYAGGSAEDALYDRVVSGVTDHAESVRIVYDPGVVSYGQLLRVFFSVVHDPTQLDRQGPDWGRHYRSNVFYADEAERGVVRAYLDQLTDAALFPREIVTRLDPLETFYEAEEDHQDFVARYPEEPYVVVFDLPKIENLRRFYPELYEAP